RHRAGPDPTAGQRCDRAVDLLCAAAGAPGLLRGPRAGRDGHLPGGPEPLPDLAGVEAGAPPGAHAVDGLRLAGDLDDVGARVGRTGLCPRGSPPALVAQRGRAGQLAADPRALLVLGAPGRVLLAAPGLRVVVHD